MGKDSQMDILSDYIVFEGIMLMGGVMFLGGFSYNVGNIKHLGFPLYILKLLVVTNISAALSSYYAFNFL